MPVHYEKGITNATVDTTMGQFVDMDESKVFGYFNDFFVYAATDWVLTTSEAGAGSATEAVADDETGGVLTVTNAGGSGDHDNFQLSNDGGTDDSESFLFALQKKAWFKARFKSNDGDMVTIHIGLHISNTDPVNAAPTDGVFFKVTTATGAMTFKEVKNSVATEETGLGTLGDDTFVSLGYYWDGVDTYYIYVNDVLTQTATATTMPDDEYLAVSFGVENGEADTNTLEIDYIGAWMER